MPDREETTETEENIDEDDTKPVQEMVESTPDKEAIDEPTTDSEQQVEESAWMMREWTTITVISVFGTLLLALGLMQATGMIDLLGSIAETELQQWTVFVVIALGVGALFLWSRRGV